MNVLHVYRTYFPDTQGGLEEAIRQICINTRPIGVNSRIFALSRDAEPQLIRMNEADVYRYKQSFEIASCGFSIDALKAFKQHVEWADIIHYYFPWPFADILHFTVPSKKPVIITYISDIVRQKNLAKLYKPLMNKFLDAADRIVVTSPNHQRNSQVLVDYQDKSTVIPIGLNQASYPRLDESLKQALKDRYGEGFFLFIGVFRYYKGLRYLIEAAANQSFKVVIAGSGRQAELAELKRQIADLGVDNVIFAGSISDQEKVAMIALSRAIVLPSIHPSEAYGITLLEGAMYGKPLISTELGTGTTYINKHNEAGLVVQPKNSQQLRDAMNILDTQHDLAKRLGEGALRRYQSVFTGEQMAVAYAKEYQNLMAK
ncbi:MAG: glycosyltransferase [Gammaproteobacteria bacterium]